MKMLFVCNECLHHIHFWSNIFAVITVIHHMRPAFFNRVYLWRCSFGGLSTREEAFYGDFNGALG